MNRMMKKSKMLFSVMLAFLMLFFWSGCGDSDNSVSKGEDTSMQDPDEEVITSSSSSSLKKNVSSSTKKQESSSSLEKSSVFNDFFSMANVNSADPTEKLSSNSEESSSSEAKSGIYSVLSGKVRTFDESRDYLLGGNDTQRGISSFITIGTGSVSFDEDGAFVLECLPEDFECFAESYIYDLGELTLGNVIDSKDDAFIEFETSSEGVISSGSYNLMFSFWSGKLGKNYTIRFVYPGDGFDDMRIKHRKEVINKESAIACGEGSKKFEVYIRDFVIPSEIIVVMDSPVNLGKNRMNLSEPLRDFDQNCESLVNRVDSVYFKSDSLMDVGVGVILQQPYEREEIEDTTRVAVWDINIPDGQGFKKD